MTETGTQRRHRDFIAVWAWLIGLTIYSFILLFDPLSDDLRFLLGLAHVDLRCVFELGIIDDFIKKVLIDQAVIAASIGFFLAAWKWQRWAVIAIFGMVTYVCILEFAVRSDGEGWGQIVGLVGIALLATAIKRIPRAWQFFEGKPFIETQNTKALNISDKHRRWLVAWLVFLLIANSFFVAAPMQSLTENLFNWDSRDTAWYAFILAGNLLNVASGLASLMWKRWGIIGLGSVTITTIAVSLALLTIHRYYLDDVMTPLIISIVGIVVLVLLLRPVWKQLSWK